MEPCNIRICRFAFGEGVRFGENIDVVVPQLVTGWTVTRKVKHVLHIPKREQTLRWQDQVLESGDLVREEATSLVLIREVQRCSWCSRHGGNALMRICAGCRSASHCDRDCQRQHWPELKTSCLCARTKPGLEADYVD